MSSTESSSKQSQLYPSLIAFDLDYTLWPLWIDTHVTGPLKRKGNTINEVLDKYGDSISLYADVPDILHEIRARGRRLGNEVDIDQDNKVIIAACSRTHAPKLASDCMNLLLVPPSIEHPNSSPTPMIGFFDEKEIYPGSKLKHFRALHQRTGIPYSQMLFFDDERRNAEVQELGVTFCHCPNGLTLDVFAQGLERWRGRQMERA